MKMVPEKKLKKALLEADIKVLEKMVEDAGEKLEGAQKMYHELLSDLNAKRDELFKLVMEDKDE
jgi:peptidoglycan hydrolase CwlO-like protein